MMLLLYVVINFQFSKGLLTEIWKIWTQMIIVFKLSFFYFVLYLWMLSISIGLDSSTVYTFYP